MENFAPIDFHRRRDFGTKIGTTFDFIRQNFKAFFRSVILIAGPPILIGSALQATFYSKFLNTLMGTARGGSPQAMEDYMLSTDFWIGVTLFILLFSLGTVVMLSVTYNYMLEYEAKGTNKIETSAVWDRVKHTIMMYFGTFILNVLLFGIGAGVMVLVIALFAPVSGFLTFMVGAIAVAAFYYLAITLSLMFVVRAYEPIGYFESISRCFYLIRGKWWSTFGLVFVMAMLQTVINYILYLPFSIANMVSMMHTLEADPFAEQSGTANLVTNILLMLNFFSAFILSTLTTIAIAFQYFNLVEMKEAKGLLSKIENIGEQPSAPRDEHY